jgi:hypothetical protein
MTKGENFLATMAAVIFTDGPRFPGLGWWL